jgi:hypothetical protein
MVEKEVMGGEGDNAARGEYHFEAAFVALVSPHILAKEPLRWLDMDVPDIPLTIYITIGDTSERETETRERITLRGSSAFPHRILLVKELEL